jgi:hypothetical protein
MAAAADENGRAERGDGDSQHDVNLSTELFCNCEIE